MNTKGRLFTFGCSFTRYHYPTWADILGREWQYFENWGEPGSGNHAIFNSIVECDARNKLSCTDTVIVMWTGLARLDIYQKFKWKHLVNLFLDDDPNVCCADGYEVQSYAYFSAIQNFLQLKQCDYVALTWTDYFPDSRIGKIYQDVLEQISNVKFDYNRKKYPINFHNNQRYTYSINLYNQMKGQGWPSLEKILDLDFDGCVPKIQLEIKNFLQLINSDARWQISNEVDGHPTPCQHLNMVDRYFSQVQINDSTRAWIKNIEEKLLIGNELDFYPNPPKERL